MVYLYISHKYALYQHVLLSVCRIIVYSMHWIPFRSPCFVYMAPKQRHYQKSVTWALRRRRNRSTWFQQGSTRCMAFGISPPNCGAEGVVTNFAARAWYSTHQNTIISPKFRWICWNVFVSFFGWKLWLENSENGGGFERFVAFWRLWRRVAPRQQRALQLPIDPPDGDTLQSILVEFHWFLAKKFHVLNVIKMCILSMLRRWLISRSIHEKKLRL